MLLTGPSNSQQMSPALQQDEPQQEDPAAHGCPLHGSGWHLPCAQNGVLPEQCVPHAPQFVGSLRLSTLQSTPLQHWRPGGQVGQLPPPEPEPLLPLEPPVLEPLLEPPPLPDPLLLEAPPLPDPLPPPELPPLEVPPLEPPLPLEPLPPPEPDSTDASREVDVAPPQSKPDAMRANPAPNAVTWTSLRMVTPPTPPSRLERPCAAGRLP